MLASQRDSVTEERQDVDVENDHMRAERDALLRDRLLLAFLVVAIPEHSYDEAWHRLEQHGYTYD